MNCLTINKSVLLGPDLANSAIESSASLPCEKSSQGPSPRLYTAHLERSSKAWKVLKRVACLWKEQAEEAQKNLQHSNEEKLRNAVAILEDIEDIIDQLRKGNWDGEVITIAYDSNRTLQGIAVSEYEDRDHQMFLKDIVVNPLNLSMNNATTKVKGVGRVLLMHIIEDTLNNPSATKMFLNSFNDVIGFYEKYGFTITNGGSTVSSMKLQGRENLEHQLATYSKDCKRSTIEMSYKKFKALVR